MDSRSTIDQRYSSDVSNRERDIPSFIEPRPPLILNPFMRPRPQKGTNLLELFEEDDSVEEEAPELVQVYLRLKPSNVSSNLYEVRSDQCLITSVDTATAGHGRRTQHNVSKMYSFSHIFRPDATQKEIFEHVVKDNLRKLPDGHNFTLLTYGASGSGKTYTLMGTVKAPGLVPRSLEYVFKVVEAAQTPVYRPGESRANKLSLIEQEHELQWVRHLRHVSAPLRDKYRRMSTRLCSDMTKSTIDLSSRTKHYVWVSFVEIYNEAIYDLLVTTERTAASKLKIREDPSGNVYVKGATQAFVRTGEEAYDVMVAGKHNLQVHATGVHAHSSRSHCIFTITMLTETESGVRSSHVRLCDLAGSERARRTRNTGARMAESRAINSSLHVLERCLHQLRRKQARHHDLVPYRESKLTRLLGAGLSGTRGEAVSMVVTLNPAPEYAHETRHVLQLAAVARDIQVNNTIAESISTLESSCSQDTTIGGSAEVVRLRADNERLHYELLQAQALNRKLMSDMAEQQEENAVTVKELVDEARDITQQYYKSQLHAQEERHENEIAELREEYEAKLAASVVAKEGTPSRALQNKVMQLMKQIALLEEELTAERLARARMNEEMLHLRACIEERDEKASDDNSQDDAIQLADSEDDSDEADDLCNDSLEPTFKKEDINRSRLLRQSSILNNTHNTTYDNANPTHGALKDESMTDNDMTDTTYDAKRDSTITEDNTDDTYDVSQNETYNQSMDCPATVKKADVRNDSVKEKSATSVDNSRDQLKHSARETYFVSNSKTSINADAEKTKNDTGNSIDTGISDSLKDEDDLKDFSIINSLNTLKTAKPIETQIDKIKKFAISTISNNSLTQFEMLELEMNDTEKKEKSAYKYFEETENNLVDLSPRKKEKKPYFDNTDPSPSQISKVKKLMKTQDLLRSPSIVQDEIPENYQPTTINKILRESYTVANDVPPCLLKNKILKKMHDSIDPFEEVESPCPGKQDVLKRVEDTEKTIEKVLLINDKIEIKTEIIDEKVSNKLKIVTEELNKVSNENGLNKEEKKVSLKATKKSTPETIEEIDKVNIGVNEKILKEEKPITKMNTDTNITEMEPITKISTDHNNTEMETITKISTDHNNTEMEPITKINPDNNNTEMEPITKISTDHNNTEMETITKINTDNNNTEMEPITKIKPDNNNTEMEPITKINTDNNNTEMEPLTKINTDTNNTEMEMNTGDNTYNITSLSDLTNVNQTLAQENNTIDAFENIYKDITAPRATDFELLISDTTLDTATGSLRQKVHTKMERNSKTYNSNNKAINDQNEQIPKDKKIEFHDKDNNNHENIKGNQAAVITESNEASTKYNLRHKTQDSNKNGIDNEVLIEDTAKCASRTVKKSLRLRRRNKGDEQVDDEIKFKDIVNLQKEFSDVTLGVPAPEKIVKDMPSPEQSESENQPPLMGAQSCPSKSVTRSRRKLFTPRAEPLDESSPVGDSGERIRVPRPSYHRARTRRRLN